MRNCQDFFAIYCVIVDFQNSPLSRADQITRGNIALTKKHRVFTASVYRAKLTCGTTLCYKGTLGIKMTTQQPFKRIALIGRQRIEGISETLETIICFLEKQGYAVVLESLTAALLPDSTLPNVHKEQLNKVADLIMVVGGDGSLLGAARIGADQNLPVLGINRGTLGFLTDIAPDDLNQILEVLSGQYISEDRFLLQARVQHDSQHEGAMIAVNDFVLLPGDKAQMITFDLYINDYFAYNLRADGLIVATPTGSTAYALSGGGPILHPSLDAIVLVPLCPHTLSSRPIVVKSDSNVRIHISDSNYTIPQISHDGQRRIPVPIGADITVTRHSNTFTLIHPMNYNYFYTLSTKLHWKG